MNIGTAAHICAAAPGGPRYDEKMSPEERSSASNGIWMCRDHGKAIDSNDPQFTVECLRGWKKQAEIYSWQQVLRNKEVNGPGVTTDKQLQLLIQTAAEKDLKVYQQSSKWPTTSVALTIDVDGLDEHMTTHDLVVADTSLGDLVLVAPPGMGKTSTIFQIANGMLSSGNGTPLIVLLGDWVAEREPVLNSILKRHAFSDISEDTFRMAASQPGVVLLLDGWNELDAEARNYVRVQVDNLKAELPELGLIVSTRRQQLDVPFGGKCIELMPLNEEQQMQIAVEIRGEEGVKTLDQAWRTAGVRELVTIPLYLTALLSFPADVVFPTTKEEVLRHFVASHEKDASHVEALQSVSLGFQQDFLIDLAEFTTRAENTSITDYNARKTIFLTEKRLAENGQITIKPQPNAVLNVLISHHVLMRVGDTTGISFQHQQFQEWYASHLVEQRIINEITDPNRRETLKAEVFNIPAWEEAILFAVDRLARGDAHQRTMCGNAIVAMFEVDPILAAEMIYRATEEVWKQIAETILRYVEYWHKPEKVDRAFRFMLTSGRSEFIDTVWPHITNQNEQISLKALRSCRQFRPSILGKDAEAKIMALSQRTRLILLCEMASHSGVDGLDLASAIAKKDTDPEVQASIVSELSFRRADRHIALVLQGASEKTFDMVIRKCIIDEVDDEEVKKGIEVAHKRMAAEKTSAYDRLRIILYKLDDKDRDAELTDIISSIEIEQQDTYESLIHEAFNHYPRAITDGLLIRLIEGRRLFYGADDILATGGYSLNDDEILQLALTDNPNHSVNANAAASVLGSQAVGRMIDALMDAVTLLIDANGKSDKAANDRCRTIEARIAHVQGKSLVNAVQLRSVQADNEQMARLAELLSRHPTGDDDRDRPFDAEDLENIRTFAEDWGNRMLISGSAKRRQLSYIAALMRRTPDISLLPLLKKMLDDNLRRYAAFREEAEAVRWRHCNAVIEAQSPMMVEYQRTFYAINAPETKKLMCEYLNDPYFGELAAQVIAWQWIAENESQSDDKEILGDLNASRVRGKRIERSKNPTTTSAEAEAIFSVIEPLIVDDASADQKKHAALLGIVAVRLPHGERHTTIEKLIALTPLRIRNKLFLNLIQSGIEINSKYVLDSLAETLEIAKKKTWMLSDCDGYEIRKWLDLLPFTNRPVDTLVALHWIPDTLRQPILLEKLVSALADTPSDGGEEVLLKIAEEDPRFYQNYMWRKAVLRLGTMSSAHSLIEITAKNVFDGQSHCEWYWSEELGKLIAEFPEVRRQVYDLLKCGVSSTSLSLAISNNPDMEGLLLLIDIENKEKQSGIWRRAIQNLVTEHVPDDTWTNSYNIVPVSAVELRQKLLAITTDGGPTDVAARCLNIIDNIRDTYGLPVSEPRHPDLSSGKPWPILTPHHVVAPV
ncbi:MAG: hypothetical protein DBP02_13330 [gamma proteobacterium symbiont of Ctena orbiculata]|nr:MAG: hypothetical protein DBP02_13330 [gamma proteobacterium symbiont of Ctena orbiculata]